MAYIVRNPSLELNSFMKGCSKDIILPKIMVVDDGLDNCSAFYHKKDEEYIYIIEDLAVGLETGLIVIPNDASIGILAHEFRHHLQHQKYNWKPNSWDALSDKFDYNNAIIKYFTGCPFEMDALLYSIKFESNDYELQWYEWIVKYYENMKIKE